MRIEHMAIYSFNLPVVNGTYRMSHGPISSVDSTLVKLTTDTGLVGWGETCPVGPIYQPHHATGARAALEQLAPGLIGEDPTRLGLLHERMDSLLGGHAYAKAAIDIAAHDLTGKHFGLRVADLLGGALTDQVPSYFAIGAGTPEETVETAEDLVRKGYPRLQLKIGGRPVAEDIAVVRSVWEHIGNHVQLAVDGNRGLTGRDALQLSQTCQDIPLVLEQPCNTIAEMTAIKDRLHHPIFFDESTQNLSVVLDAVAHHLCDGVAMKVTRVGGIRPMAQVRDMCQIRSMPHTIDDAWGGDVIAAACVQVAATVRPRLNEGVWIAEPFVKTHYDPQNPIEVKDGYIQLPDAPGLGVVPDEKILGEPSVTFS